MSNNVTLTVKKTAPAPAGAVAEDAAAQAETLGRKDEKIEGSNAGFNKVVLGASAAVFAAAVAMSIMTPKAASILYTDKKEGISAAVLQQLQSNRTALEKNGLKAGTIKVRDWGAIDGDAAVINGAFIGPLQATYQPISLGAGAVSIKAKAGAVGCVTIEIADATGAAHQVCVNDGDPINTFAK